MSVIADVGTFSGSSASSILDLLRPASMLEDTCEEGGRSTRPEAAGGAAAYGSGGRPQTVHVSKSSSDLAGTGAGSIDLASVIRS